MKISILTVGSTGDVLPYVALGKELVSAGHTVTLGAHARFKQTAEVGGVGFFSVEGDPQAVLEGEAGRKWLETRNPVSYLRGMVKASEPFLRSMLDSFIEACEDTELILFHILAAFPAVSIAEKMGVKSVSTYLTHVHPTWSYPNVLAMPCPKGGKIYNRMTYPPVAWLYWHLLRSNVNRWRAEKLGLPPWSFRGPLNQWLKERRPCIYGFSRHVIPRPPEWGPEVHLTGNWVSEPDQG